MTVLDAENRAIADAHVLIELEGKAPLDEYTDANGFARIIVPTTHAARPGRMTVSARSYEVYITKLRSVQRLVGTLSVQVN